MAFSVAFTLVTLLIFLFIYWQTTLSETARIDALLVAQADALAQRTPAEVLRAVGERLANDLHRVGFAGVFNAAGQPMGGNLRALPADLPVDGRAHRTDAALADDALADMDLARAVARPLPDGRILVIGRSVEELVELRRLTLRAIGLGLVPAVLLSFGVSVIISIKTLDRVKGIHQAMARIMHGHIDERLPASGSRDDLDKLVAGVNEMLDEIASLLNQMRGVGDDIAHDLRTPLTRLRTRLERSRSHPSALEDLHVIIDRSIADLDQTLTIITALLRLGEIEGARRRMAFGTVELDGLIHEVHDLYSPMAEARGVTLDIAGDAPCSVQGDRDLLIEAVANLVDNAIKFTPARGAVRLSTLADDGGCAGIRVADNGAGIPPDERAAVLKRFYRSDKSRNVAGSGLGLSLVAAIARLHGLELRITDNAPGCVVELVGTDGGRR